MLAAFGWPHRNREGSQIGVSASSTPVIRDSDGDLGHCRPLYPELPLAPRRCHYRLEEAQKRVGVVALDACEPCAGPVEEHDHGCPHRADDAQSVAVRLIVGRVVEEKTAVEEPGNGLMGEKS